MAVEYTFNPFMIFQSLLGTFLGAALAFWAQSHKFKKEEADALRDHILKAYRQNIANLQTLLSYKNNFFNDLNFGFDALESFCGEFLDVGAANNAQMKEQWDRLYLPLLKRSMSYGSEASGVYKQRWEKPELFRFETSDISFIAKSSPDVLSIVAYIHSTINLLSEELSKRDNFADGMEKFIGSPEPFLLPQRDAVRQLFMLFRSRSLILEALDRGIALSFGLSALLENYYFRKFKKFDFMFVKYSQENLSMMPPIEEYINFYGDDMSGHIVKTRHERAWNSARGHRELNLPTSIMPPRIK